MNKVVINSVLFLMTFSLAFLLLDGYIYYTGISRKSEVYFSEETGKSYRSNYNYIWFSEGFSIGTINPNNYLGPNYKVTKPKNVKRIALLGDSYVEGFQVFERNHFRNVLEKQLNVLTDSFEVLNFGRSNFNLQNMYAYQKLRVNKYRPDIILYFVSEEDLVSFETDNLLPNLETKTLAAAPYKSRENLNSFKRANFLMSRSSIIYMTNSARHKVQHDGWKSVLFDGKFDVAVPVEFKKIEIPEVNKRILNEMETSKIVFVYREKRPMNHELKAAISKAGIRLIDLSGFLIKLDKAGDNPNYWQNQKADGHWNINGHKAVGGYLAPLISSMLE